MRAPARCISFNGFAIAMISLDVFPVISGCKIAGKPTIAHADLAGSAAEVCSEAALAQLIERLGDEYLKVRVWKDQSSGGMQGCVSAPLLRNATPDSAVTPRVAACPG